MPDPLNEAETPSAADRRKSRHHRGLRSPCRHPSLPPSLFELQGNDGWEPAAGHKPVRQGR